MVSATVLQRKECSRSRADMLSQRAYRVILISWSVIRSRGAVVELPMLLISYFAPMLLTGEVSSPFANIQSIRPILPNRCSRKVIGAWASAPMVVIP